MNNGMINLTLFFTANVKRLMPICCAKTSLIIIVFIMFRTNKENFFGRNIHLYLLSFCSSSKSNLYVCQILS